MVRHSFSDYRIIVDLFRTLDRLGIYSFDNYKTGPRTHSFPVIDFTDRWMIK